MGLTGETCSVPSDAHILRPGGSTSMSNIPQLVFAQPPITYDGSQTPDRIPPTEDHRGKENHRSKTWTSSSENLDLGLEEDGKDNRERFVLEYNRLAQRHGIRPLIPHDFNADDASNSLGGRRGSWLSKMLRQVSEQSDKAATKPDNQSLRRQRSLSDVALNFVHSNKRDGLKNQDLRVLIRLCGKSPLFLPTDYAPHSLTLPTCLRALAQALVQHADTRGLFRVCGSSRVINALYDYYCTNEDTDAVSSTTRCPTLPTNIRCNAHDIASTFKRFLAGLPGGILGSLSLFDALVAIHTQLQGDAELHRTKESKLRARLIALAIGTVESQYRRELICGVFGLLCLVGRVAENAPREDENGCPLRTTDLMGYNALGIVFGPLLIGDMINDYSMKVADPSAGLVLLPVSPPRSRKERQKHRHKRGHRHRHKHPKRHTPSVASSFTLDKTHVANSITEMLIVHWREVVRQIRSTGSVRTKRNNTTGSHYPEGISIDRDMSSSIYGNVCPQNTTCWDHTHPRSASPSTASQTPSRGPGPAQGQAARRLLSPTIEESPSPHANNAGTLHYQVLQQANPAGGLEISQPQSRDVNIGEKRLDRIEPGEKTVLSANDPPSEPLISHDSHHDTSRNEDYKRQITDPPGRGGDYVMSKNGLVDIRVRAGHESKILTGSLADPWKRLLASSKTSTESLAKSAKERRLNRSSGHIISSHSSQDASILEDPRPMTPEWKRQLVRERSEPNESSTTRWPSKCTLGGTPHSTHPASKNQIQRAHRGVHVINTPHRRYSQRSISKPTPGAVRAMAALFENAARESPSSSAMTLSGRSRPSVRGSTSFSRLNIADESPTKPKPSRRDPTVTESSANIDKHPGRSKITETLSTNKHPPASKAPSTLGTAPGQPVTEDTPARTLHILKPVSAFSSARKESQSSSNKPAHEVVDRSQPLRLGLMVPHQEEPPVGYFVRPSSAATSAQSQHWSALDDDTAQLPPPLTSSASSSFSSLHAQIRSLQRQLECKDEELAHLRRRLETQEHMDIGTLCEQLRLTKRECMTWRKRAEAAERRVAVFQRFGSRFQATPFPVTGPPKDGAADDDDDDQHHHHHHHNKNNNYCRYNGDGSSRDTDGAPVSMSATEDVSPSSSCYSARTETREVFRDRLRQNFARHAENAAARVDGPGGPAGTRYAGTHPGGERRGYGRPRRR